MSKSKNNHFDVDILRCNGDLNAVSMVRIKNRLNRLLERNHKKMVLDLSRTRHVDLAGLGILVERLRKMRSVNGDIKLCNISPQVSETFRLVGVSKLIETYNSQEEALKSFEYS